MEEKIRNFVIIAHIDSGKSTLADRFLEITGTVEARNMRPQYLDKMELERERGITIKMAPVRMVYHPNGTIDNLQLTTDQKSQKSEVSGQRLPKSEYILNLIDTPGHSDFGYEVSRALAAVEGAVLLVDAAKGIQAQTLSNFRAAKRAGLTIVGAVNKVDLKLPNLEKIVGSLADLLEVAPEEIFRVSAKTGQGVRELLEAVIEKVPAPRIDADQTRISADTEKNISEHPRSNPRSSAFGASRALIFDSLYDDHKGILAFVRVFGGEFRGGDELQFLSNGARFRAKEVGQFAPALKAVQTLPEGSIGYIATGLKEPALVKIGDTVAYAGARAAPLPGYREPTPVVFISFYPDGRTKFGDLEEGLERLRLNDAALSFEPDANDALGRGLKVGFLGQLHFDITASRLKREFNLEFLTSFPSIAYKVLVRNSADVRGLSTRIDADKDIDSKLIYEDISYKIRGCFFNVYNTLGPGQKEGVYHKALESEFRKASLHFEKEQAINVIYDDKNIGVYRPDFVIENKILIEVKALPAIAVLQKTQTWNYLKGSTYKLALLVNFGGKKLEIERIVYDTARPNIRENPRLDPRESAMTVKVIKQPQDFPDKPDQVFQPMIRVEILTPSPYLNYVVNLKKVFDLEISDIKNLGENLLLTGAMPLAELIRDFDDQLKSVSSGFASFNYELSGEAPAEVLKLEVLIAGEVIPALTRIVPTKDADREARATVERLKKLLPAQQFTQAIQGRARGRIVARETIPALRKDVTGYLYGGDRTRKMKLWKKQKRGKEKLKSMARVELSPEVFREILKK